MALASNRRFSFARGAVFFAAFMVLVSAATAGQATYTTDPASGRLTKATYPDGTYITYSYDANGSLTSAVVTQPADTQAPTAPTGLAATVVSATRIDLAWTASTDDRAVTGYRLERCQGASCANFSEIAQPATPSYQNTGLTSGVSYSYRVRAADAAGNLSGYSNTATRTTTDNIPPTTPGTPVISGITATTAVATWTGSTDNVGVTGYQYRLNGGTWVTTGAGTATTFTITGLTSATTYTVNIRARDAAPNFSVSSAAATLTTLDNIPPTTPGTPTVTALTATTATVTWTGSTDNVGVTGYQYRLNGGTWVTTGAGTATTFTATGLTPSTTYTINIRARDAAPNFSASSATTTLTTPSATDTTAPTTPGTPTFTAITMTGATASWTASTDAVGVTGYQYSLNGGTWTNTGSASATFTLTGLTSATAYTLAVRAKDAAGNTSTASANGSFTTLADTTAPTAPGTPTFTAITATSVTASWTGSTDNVAVTGYQYRLNGGTWISTGSTATSFTITGLTDSTTYAVAIRARDQAANFSASSANGSVTTLDGTAPTTPGTPTFSSITATSATASWTASTDNVAVTGYEYSLNSGAWTSTGSASPSVGLSGLSGSTTYTLAVRARDAAGNFSSASGTGSFGTSDTTAPSTPGTPGFSSITATSATASWTASTDNVAVTGYEYSLSGGAWTATGSASPSVGLSGLSGSTTYTLAVRARDAAGNFSGASGSGSFTTSDTTAPSAPGTPTFSSITGSSASVSWGAATDNVGVTGYQYRVNGGGLTAVSAPPVALSGLSSATTYTVDVQARDAVGNWGPFSSASFTTTDTVAPSAPGTPTFSSVTGTSATASWGAASDNVGVTGYQWRLNAGGWNATAGTSASLTGLSANTTYTVDVQARDAAGNWGASSSASFTTPAAITITNRNVTTSGQSFTVQATYRLTSAGDIWVSSASGGAETDVGDWIVPKSGMTNYQVRQASGNCNGPPPGLWIQFGTSDPQWLVIYGGSGPGSATCSMSIEISAVANPSVILGSAFITLTAVH